MTISTAEPKPDDPTPVPVRARPDAIPPPEPRPPMSAPSPEPAGEDAPIEAGGQRWVPEDADTTPIGRQLAVETVEAG